MLAGSTERADAARGRITVPAQAPRLPVIIDTEIGGEPDDAIALAVAARELPELALVVTSDEISGQRARFTRFLLDSLHRPDVDVVAGGQLSAKPCYFADGLTPAEVAGQPGDLALAVAEVCARGDGRARWIGLGPLTNLAAVLTADPGLAGRLSVTQLGGSVWEGRPSVPQRNFRLDPASARIVLAAARDLRVVNVDAAFGRDAPVTAASPLYRELADASAPGWARLLAAHCAQFFARYHPAVIPASPAHPVSGAAFAVCAIPSGSCIGGPGRPDERRSPGRQRPHQRPGRRSGSGRVAARETPSGGLARAAGQQQHPPSLARVGDLTGPDRPGRQPAGGASVRVSIRNQTVVPALSCRNPQSAASSSTRNSPCPWAAYRSPRTSGPPRGVPSSMTSTIRPSGTSTTTIVTVPPSRPELVCSTALVTSSDVRRAAVSSALGPASAMTNARARETCSGRPGTVRVPRTVAAGVMFGGARRWRLMGTPRHIPPQ
jgi:inosine-uridine nucleoside N-ribohydrolase